MARPSHINFFVLSLAVGHILLPCQLSCGGKIVNLGSNLGSPENQQGVTSCEVCPVCTGQGLG